MPRINNYSEMAARSSEAIGGISGHKESIALRRARLVVECATALSGKPPGATDASELRLDLTVAEFHAELIKRYGAQEPALTERSDSSIERARLTREQGWDLPRVFLRRGAPRGWRMRRAERLAQQRAQLAAAQVGSPAPPTTQAASPLRETETPWS